ncbi:MAG: endonuclease/exonuclease/phosphatase family protein [Alphaproteobacteria bacterium]
MDKFSFLAWNIRHFKVSEARLNDVDAFITELDPDVFGLIEYQGKAAIRELMVERFPEYDFAVTDSTGNLEVVVGFRRGKFEQVVWTQKRQFNDVKRHLRPGALISLRYGGEFYNLLFLHTDSGTTESDYRNRKKVFSKVWKLKKALGKRSRSGRSNLIVLGDLNTMGKGRTISGETEIRYLEKAAKRSGMRFASKDFGATWSQWGKGPRGNRRKLRSDELAGLTTSNLDHVIVADEIEFVPAGDNGEDIHVKGWRQLDGADKATFLWSLSDHCGIYGRVK